MIKIICPNYLKKNDVQSVLLLFSFKIFTTSIKLKPAIDVQREKQIIFMTGKKNLTIKLCRYFSYY